MSALSFSQACLATALTGAAIWVTLDAFANIQSWRAERQALALIEFRTISRVTHVKAEISDKAQEFPYFLTARRGRSGADMEI